MPGIGCNLFPPLRLSFLLAATAYKVALFICSIAAPFKVKLTSNCCEVEGRQASLEVQSDEVIQAKQALNTQSTTTTDCACKCSINAGAALIWRDKAHSLSQKGASNKQSIKKPAGKCPVISMLRNLKVLLGKTVSAAGIQVDQTICQRAFADGFHDEPAGNNMAFSGHTRDVDTLKKYGEHYLLADRVDTEGWWTF